MNPVPTDFGPLSWFKVAFPVTLAGLLNSCAVKAGLGTIFLSLTGCHPSTSVGMIGYKNSGFEKQLSIKVIPGPDNVTPMSYDYTGDGKPDGYIWEATVENDATKAYAYNQFLVTTGVNLVNKVLDAVIATRANAPTTPPPTQEDRIAALSSKVDLLVTTIERLRSGVAPAPTPAPTQP